MAEEKYCRKLRKGLSRTGRKTPYDRLGSATRSPKSKNSASDNNSNDNWLLKMIEPAQKIIINGAQKLFPSVFLKRICSDGSRAVGEFFQIFEKKQITLKSDSGHGDVATTSYANADRRTSTISENNHRQDLKRKSSIVNYDLPIRRIHHKPNLYSSTILCDRRTGFDPVKPTENQFLKPQPRGRSEIYRMVTLQAACTVNALSSLEISKIDRHSKSQKEDLKRKSDAIDNETVARRIRQKPNLCPSNSDCVSANPLTSSHKRTSPMLSDPPLKCIENALQETTEAFKVNNNSDDIANINVSSIVAMKTSEDEVEEKANSYHINLDHNLTTSVSYPLYKPASRIILDHEEDYESGDDCLSLYNRVSSSSHLKPAFHIAIDEGFESDGDTFTFPVLCR